MGWEWMGKMARKAIGQAALKWNSVHVLGTQSHWTLGV